MSEERITFKKYMVGMCLGEKLPVWATIVGIIIGAVVTGASTFWIVPRLNASLEKQKIRTEFVIRNLDDLNSRTRSLVSDISELQANIINTNAVDASAIQKSTSKIAEMQWKAIELGIIFENSDGIKTVRNYQKSLDDVRLALVDLKSKSDLPQSQAAIERLSRSTLDVIRELARLGGLQLDTGTVAPKF